MCGGRGNGQDGHCVQCPSSDLSGILCPQYRHRAMCSASRTSASGYRGGCSACASRLALIGESGTATTWRCRGTTAGATRPNVGLGVSRRLFGLRLTTRLDREVRHLLRQALCIHPVPQFFPTFCPAFSFCGTQKGKANIKSFGKGWGVQGGRKEPFSKGFSFPLPAGLRNKPDSRQSPRPMFGRSGTFAAASQQSAVPV